MTECIHGLDIELCDICAPRKTPEAQDPAATKAAPPVRRAPARSTSLRSTPSSLRPAVARPARRTAEPSLPDIDLASMRVHHWTHRTNLPAILEAGELRADAEPALDVSAPEARERRAAAAVPSGTPVAGHVPFTLSPDASSWDEVRRGAEGDQWSAAARSARPTDFVVLVAPVQSLGDDFVLVDGDPTGALARFAAGASEAAVLARRASMTDPGLVGVEILVPESFPLGSVSLIGVPNDKARDEVKALLRDVGGVAPRVAVYPPWFRPSEV